MKDALTWRFDENAITYYLNGVLIAREPVNSHEGTPMRVIAAIRSYAPRFDRLDVAYALWECREEEIG